MRLGPKKAPALEHVEGPVSLESLHPNHLNDLWSDWTWLNPIELEHVQSLVLLGAFQAAKGAKAPAAAAVPAGPPGAGQAPLQTSKHQSKAK